MAEIWPSELSSATPNVWYDARTVSGGVSLSGKEQVAARDFGTWRANLAGISIATRTQVLAVRRLFAALDGRAGTVLIPMFDQPRAPWGYDTQGRRMDPQYIREPALDQTPFTDASSLVDGLISATVQNSAMARASTIVINMIKGSIPEAGMHFGIGNHAYRIRAVTSVAGSVATCSIRPGLRAAVAAGAAVNFTSPVIEMRLTSDDQAQLPLDLWKFATISLDFVEA